MPADEKGVAVLSNNRNNGKFACSKHIKCNVKQMIYRVFPDWTSISPSNSSPLYMALLSSELYWPHGAASLSPARPILKRVGDVHNIRPTAV